MNIKKVVAAVGVLGAAALTVTVPAQAAGQQATATSSVTVSGTTATATTAVSVTPGETVQKVGVCARSASGQNVDFPLRSDVALSPAATTVTASRTLAAGTYTYFTCLQAGGTWYKVGTDKTFTVGAGSTGGTGVTVPANPRPVTQPPVVVAPTTPPTAPPTTTPAPPATGALATTAAPRGDLPGWKQVFAEDFTTPAATGSFPGTAYGTRWTRYDGFKDTDKRGLYAPAKVLSVHDGALDMHLRTENGVPLVAAPVPLVDGKWFSQKYGRYSVRFKADPVPGYKTAWLLWPQSNDWNQGEIDFPEGGLDGTIHAFNHCVGNPTANCFATDTGARYTEWHTATIEWTPTGVTFFLDGRNLGTSATSPSAAMQWVLQTETSGSGPAAGASGHVLVDWAVMYSRAA